jgi:GT2 family glycosyltransferase
MSFSEPESISVIVPTIGRPESLIDLLASLAAQTVRVQEVMVADGSGKEAVKSVCADSRWLQVGLHIHWIPVAPPNAVQQREAAINISQGEFLLLLDDDVVLEPLCIQHMLALLKTNLDVVGVTADFNNQSWPQPTRFWSLYLRYVLGLSPGAWQGRVVGPLLRFGYNPLPESPQPMEWLGSGNSLVRRSAYIQAGGFSDFFLHRCTINEDVDFSLKLSRIGRILFCPAARMAHYHAPGGRVSVAEAAEDDLFNRFMVLHRTLHYSKWKALLLVVFYILIESLSNTLGAIKRVKANTTVDLLKGRMRGLIQIGRICLGYRIQNAGDSVH